MNIQADILEAVQTNDLREIETVLNNFDVQADIVDRGTDEERLVIPGFGEVYFDGRFEERPGFVVREYLSVAGWEDTPVEPEELVDMLNTLVEYANAMN